MKGGSDIISGIHRIRQAYEHFQSFVRERPGTKGEVLVKGYAKKLEWIAKDLITHPALPEIVREGVRQEWESDVFAPDAIGEKLPLLRPDQRGMIETLVDAMLAGEEINLIQHANN